jgi:hypothetical protein
MPLTEPGVCLSIRTGLPRDVNASSWTRVDTASLLKRRGVTPERRIHRLPPQPSCRHSSPVFLRHVRGSAARRLLRRLRPLSRDITRLGGLPAGRRSTAGSRVHEENPRCVRWSTLPLAILIGGSSRLATDATVSLRCSSAFEIDAPDLIASSADRQRVVIRTETSDIDFNVRATEHACFTLASVLASQQELALLLDAFNAVRLLQLVVPTSTRFTAPLLAQPDSSREKSLASRSSSRLTAHISYNVEKVKSVSLIGCYPSGLTKCMRPLSPAHAHRSQLVSGSTSPSRPRHST